MPASVKRDADDLWRFALDLYAGPGVETACLALQDDFDADIVLLIGLMWLAATDGRPVSAPDIALLDAALVDWRDSVVGPLRGLRRSLKPRLAQLPEKASDVRDLIKAAELEAERVAFGLLAAALAELPLTGGVEKRQIAAQRTADCYFSWLEKPPTPALCASLAVLVDSLGPERDPRPQATPAGLGPKT